MHTYQLVDPIDRPNNEAVALLLREAKRLHHAATTGPLVSSLPVLRRLLATGAIPRAPLPDVFRRRATLQRKHFLRILAVEAGFKSWEAYRPALALMNRSELQHMAVAQRGPGYINLWFRNLAEANAFASAQGGHAVRMGRHAVVLPSYVA